MYEHDCDQCVPLGEHGDRDLYWCNQGGPLPTVLARFGDRPEDYTSGMALAQVDTHLAEAKRRAEDRGLATVPAV